FALPGFFPQAKLELAEAALESLAFAALAAGSGVLRSQLFEMGSDEAGESGVLLHGDLTHVLHQLFVKGKRNIHVPIIRETLKLCKYILSREDPFYLAAAPSLSRFVRQGGEFELPQKLPGRLGDAAEASGLHCTLVIA